MLSPTCVIKFCMSLSPWGISSVSKALLNTEVDMYNNEYLSQNCPPPPTNIKSKLELFNHLFLFGSYYLQQYPRKVVSFFDYLMYLMEQAENMSPFDLASLGHKIRHDFTCHPDWNWAQHRPETRKSIDRVLNKIKLRDAAFACRPSAPPSFPQPCPPQTPAALPPQSSARGSRSQRGRVQRRAGGNRGVKSREKWLRMRFATLGMVVSAR